MSSCRERASLEVISPLLSDLANVCGRREFVVGSLFDLSGSQTTLHELRRASEAPLCHPVEGELAVFEDDFAAEFDDGRGGLVEEVGFASRAEDLADLGDDAADVGIVARDRAFQEGPVDELAPQGARVLDAVVSADDDADDVIRAFAVPYDVVPTYVRRGSGSKNAATKDVLRSVSEDRRTDARRAPKRSIRSVVSRCLCPLEGLSDRGPSSSSAIRGPRDD